MDWCGPAPSVARMTRIDVRISRDGALRVEFRVVNIPLAYHIIDLVGGVREREVGLGGGLFSTGGGVCGG